VPVLNSIFVQVTFIDNYNANHADWYSQTRNTTWMRYRDNIKNERFLIVFVNAVSKLPLAGSSSCENLY